MADVTKPDWVHVDSAKDRDHRATKPVNPRKVVQRCEVCGFAVVKSGKGDYR